MSCPVNITSDDPNVTPEQVQNVLDNMYDRSQLFRDIIDALNASGQHVDINIGGLGAGVVAETQKNLFGGFSMDIPGALFSGGANYFNTIGTTSDNSLEQIFGHEFWH